jgi:type IV pilus assembly protein PilY1
MRTDFVRSLWLAGLFGVCAVSAARADEPDLRSIPPFVMILADTSGSMEYRTDCQCPSSSGCPECYPRCSDPNVSGVAPVGKKNRWAVLLESLTGTFTDFQCVQEERTESAFTYDRGYSLPHHRPWTCPIGSPYCPYPGTDTVPIQTQNGLLDNYANRLRFGLATFDGQRTYMGAGDLVTTLDSTKSEGAEGMYSYGGAKKLRYPSCTQTHLIDSGIRSAAAPEGGLISLDTTGLCTTLPCDSVVVSEAIQRKLLATRPYGGTPTASALDDLYTHYKQLNDSMASCRDRYAILITDGYPDDDFREYPNPGCDCIALGNCPANDNVGMECPYPTAADAAYNLKNGKSDSTTSDPPQIKQLFVVGMSIADDKSKAGLNAIASQGGSQEAYFADDPTTLTTTLDKLFANITKPISRSVPAFAMGETGVQYQVSAGFSISAEKVPTGFTPPWIGSIERRRFMCDSTGAVTVPPLSAEDKFDVQLNERDGDKRDLWTALPENPTPTLVQGSLDRIDVGTKCGAGGCPKQSLLTVPIGLLGSGVDAAEQAKVLAWMYGLPGSVREKHKLGDIYHSSPTIVGPPVADPGDQSYTMFREWDVIQDRPMMMYVNSNDGILHAFVLENLSAGGKTYKAGEELWGFVPPILLPTLKDQLGAHRLNLDSTPVVKDVYFKKGPLSPAKEDYKTVLITGMRSGGNAYIALDVTNPSEPKFMWQFKGAEMGQTYGQPLIVQARYQWPPGSPATLRAMAILPGGKGEPDTTWTGPGCSATSKSRKSFRVPGADTRYETKLDPKLEARTLEHRSEVPCWKAAGRALYFVDVETGKEIKKLVIDSSNNQLLFPSPVIGSPTAYQDSVGMTATEGFVLDADGVLWRIDLSKSDQQKDDALSGWTVRPFHDLFWDMGPNEGETTYERPILSLDDQQRLVVIVGTGDTDNFEKPGVKNRIVSLTQLTKSTSGVPGPADYIGAVNWELRASTSGNDFVTSELVTGTMALFAQQLFVASFISQPGTDPCDAGLGRLWSFHYTQRDELLQNDTNDSLRRTYSPKRIAMGAPSTSTADARARADLNLFNIPKANAEKNLLVLGLGSTQRISSCELGETLDSNYYQPGSTITNIVQKSQPSIWIVGQASSGGSENDERKRAGSLFGTMEVQVARPPDFARVSSWAGSIE